MKDLNFQKIANIENRDFYLDLAFRRAKKAAERIQQKEKRVREMVKTKRKKKFIKRIKIKSHKEYKKDESLARINAIQHTLSGRFKIIIKSFPSIENLPQYYKDVLRLRGFDLTKIKKCLATLRWFNDTLSRIHLETIRKTRKAKFFDDIIRVQKEFYGRISSLMKRISPCLDYLKDVKIFILSLPIIKEMYSVVIVGFPNVGKTTLLNKLSGSKAKISHYPFTTLDINIGKFKGIQLIDTPGTLNREDKMNLAEKIAYLAMKYYGDLFIYLIDLTEPYSID